MRAPKRSGSDFAKFWTGQTISQLGSSFTLFALPLLVFKLTGSAVNLAITTASEMVTSSPTALCRRSTMTRKLSTVK